MQLHLLAACMHSDCNWVWRRPSAYARRAFKIKIYDCEADTQINISRKQSPANTGLDCVHGGFLTKWKRCSYEVWGNGEMAVGEWRMQIPTRHIHVWDNSLCGVFRFSDWGKFSRHFLHLLLRELWYPLNTRTYLYVAQHSHSRYTTSL